MDMIDTYYNLENMSLSEKQTFFKSLESILKECKNHNIEVDPFLNTMFVLREMYYTQLLFNYYFLVKEKLRRMLI